MRRVRRVDGGGSWVTAVYGKKRWEINGTSPPGDFKDLLGTKNVNIRYTLNLVPSFGEKIVM